MPSPDRPVPKLHYGGAWFGLIARDVVNFSDKCFVVIPSFSEEHQFGPCRWQARDDVSKPAEGEPCLVIFDNFRTPWVVSWWPFDE